VLRISFAFLAIAAFLGAATVQACDLEVLSQTYPAPAEKGEQTPRVAFSLDGKVLRAHFEVKSKSVYGRARLAPNEFPYMFDVAEVFVSVAGGAPYYEFELTPLDQILEVRIFYATQPQPGAPPKKSFQNGIDIGLEHKVSRSPGGWTADLGIPLERLGWQGDPAMITGDAHVILGQGHVRRYFSRSLPAQAKPNFHLPEYFKPLLCEPAAHEEKRDQAAPLDC
jgi:hypothetical protein